MRRRGNGPSGARGPKGATSVTGATSTTRKAAGSGAGARASLQFPPASAFVGATASSAPVETLQLAIEKIRRWRRKHRGRLNKKGLPPAMNLNLDALMIMDVGLRVLLKELEKAAVPCKILKLSLNGLTAEGLDMLAAYIDNPESRLEELHLQSNEITGDGMRAFAKALKTNTSLKRLMLQNNKLGSEVGANIAVALRHNTTCWRKLNLWANPLTDEGFLPIAMALASNRPQVQEVCLRRCQLTCRSAEAIAQALRTNSTITVLDLSHNTIEDEGAIALAQAMERSNRTVSILDLRSNFIGERGLLSLEKMLTSNRAVRKLELEGNMGSTSWPDFSRRVEKLLDFNEIGYWLVVEKQLEQERERQEKEREQQLLDEIEREITGGGV